MYENDTTLDNYYDLLSTTIIHVLMSDAIHKSKLHQLSFLVMEKRESLLIRILWQKRVLQLAGEPIDQIAHTSKLPSLSRC